LVSEAIFALHEAWVRNRERLCLVSDDPVRHAEFNRDGTRIVTASKDPTAAECSRAVPRSQGMNEAFSTGSQYHQPPQPST
jgi:hypothetical protein